MSWKNVQYENGKRRTSDASPAGSSTLSGLDDVSLSSPSNDQVLTYDANEQKWKNKDASGGTVTDVEYGGSSVVDQNGVAKIPKAPISDVQVNDSSVVDQDGVAKVVVPDAPVQDVTYNGTSVVNQNGVAVVPVPNIPVTDVEVNGQSVLDNKVAKVVSYKEVTEAEYNALPASKLSDGILYAIKDSVGAQEGFPPLIYSEEERCVGVWKNGKPLYQKWIIVNFTVISRTDDWTSIDDVSPLNIATLVDCLSLCNTYSYMTREFSARIHNGNLEIYSGHTGWGIDSAVIWYTKTTDTPGSGMWNTQGGLAQHYSTTEHIIGTWIDGKPLYEKTVEFGALPNNNQKWVAHNISNIDKITSFKSISFDGNDFISLPYVSIDTTWECQFHVNKTSMYARTKGDKSSFTWTYVTLQYTKTTD